MGDIREATEDVYTMDEVRKHNSPDDAWLVVGDGVYDITNFWKKHPGGKHIILNFKGMDATEMYNMYHMRKEEITDKYLQTFRKGKVEPESVPDRTKEINKDFKELTELCYKMGLFDANFLDVLWHWAQIFFFIGLSMWIIHYFGTGMIPLTLSALILALGQVLAGYAWHDFSHRGVTHKVPIDYFFEQIAANILIGFSCQFMTIWHNLHHTFPHNTGAVMTPDKDKEERPPVPLHRKIYQFFTTPPAMFPYLWTIASVKLAVQNKSMLNLVTFGMYYGWYLGFFASHLGPWVLLHWLLNRQFWVHMGFFTSLANHLDIDIPEHEKMPYFEYQARASINFTRSTFIEWISGGQNQQIEHHLWPHMPKSGLHKAAPLVESLCKKWGIEYKIKEPLQAYKDVFKKIGSAKPGTTTPSMLWNLTMYKTQ